MKKFSFILISLFVIAGLILTGCKQVETPVEEVHEVPVVEEPAEEVVEEPVVEEPAEEVVEEPVVEEPVEEVTLGTEANPIQWVFVPSGELEEVSAGAEVVADLIFEETGLVVETFVATDYTAAIEALCADQAQMGSLATFAAITAADRGCAFPELVAVRYGLSTYNGQLIAGADSGITGWADLAGKTFCATDETSTSGWIIPSIEMRAVGLDPEVDVNVTFAGSHDAAVLGVYRGDCDAGATYVDARTSVEDKYPDVNDKVIQVTTTSDIPNDGVQFTDDFPEDMKQTLIDALLAIIATEEGQAAMDQAYEWDGLEVHDNTFYDPFRQLLDAAGITAEDY